MTQQDWWRGAVIYQIYPRSFQDADGDGMGDLKGITQRLDHVARLGVDAIWVSPFFKSPMADMGYDVSDYCDVDPTFGTLDDFEAMVARAHELGLKVIIDQVFSHSSDQHPFFEESRSSRDNPKHDWYVWADPRPDGSPPSNWQAIFGGPAWTWDVRRRQYYFHQFLPQQPDLNAHNPEVQEWILETMEFWLEKGIDGFRLDAINHLFHDAELRDNPPDWRPKSEPDYKPFEMQYPIMSKNQPETLVFLERVRALLDRYGATSVGEIGEGHHPVERLMEYTAPGRLHMGYSLALTGAEFTPEHIRTQLEDMFAGGDGWPCWAFSSHDHNRPVTRWARYGASPEAMAKLTASILLTLPGSICMYQGEELGLPDTELERHEIVDPEGKAFWPHVKGRDMSRTPMVWEAAAPNAGFSQANSTWLPVKPPQAERAVDTQEGVGGSVLETVRALLALRKDPALRGAETVFHDVPDPVLAYTRGDKFLCVFNIGAEPVHLSDLPLGEAVLTIDAEAGETLCLGPNGVWIGHTA
ncbi:alpha-glucosidase [Jannaschia seohaensis]|uniref:Alpha-glucosidase n=1 Tax=Jannaschia seohaensis TaxID=475081 RepID=A0A2Y9ABF2_9RHOB|nr:alpha-glucosidase [Jannaschia seohaensis]PWJ21200.1 alpha-glucosidase [Jannaschia seohaensis]SSA41610.1 alpha-glucosidase [Jannaschia seohaensis]